MFVDVNFTTEAEFDVDDAYSWYEDQHSGLGEQFLSSLDACIRKISRTPEAFPIVLANYRRALLRRFPYSLFFETSTQTLTIYCVFHNARDPEKWRKRLP